MKFKRFGLISDELSTVGFGCWGLSGGTSWTTGNDQQGINTVRAAIDLGVNFFDVAPVYGRGHAEELLGKGIAGQRSKLFIASKCGLVWDDPDDVSINLTKDSIFKEIDMSLARLGTDYLDLYQMHWPDSNTPIEESLEALATLRDAGKIRHIGLTNFSLEDAQKAQEMVGLSSYQGLYNLLEHNPVHYHNIPLAYRSKTEMLPFCKANAIPFLPYSPLMQGLLTEYFNPSEWAEDDVRQPNPKFHGELWLAYRDLAQKVKDFANQIGQPVAQVAMNWLVNQAEVGPVICGGTEPVHIQENAQSQSWSLSDSEFEQLNALVSDSLNELEGESSRDNL